MSWTEGEKPGWRGMTARNINADLAAEGPLPGVLPSFHGTDSHRSPPAARGTAPAANLDRRPRRRIRLRLSAGVVPLRRLPGTLRLQDPLQSEERRVGKSVD